MYCQYLSLIRNFVREISNIIQFASCGYEEEVIEKYIIHAVLTVIEDKEKENISAMRYSDFVKVKVDEVLNRITEFLHRLHHACARKHLDGHAIERIYNALSQYNVVKAAICYLYSCGINNDGIPFILIQDRDYCNKDAKEVDNNEIIVKSRFSELAHYLANLKQRFADRSVFEAKQLVSRVFAFNELRKVPVPRRDAEQIASSLTDYAEKFYSMLCKTIWNNSSCTSPDELKKVIREFLKKLGEGYGLRRYYEFQYKALATTWNNLLEVLQGGEKYIILKAPTGSGKSEVFLLTSLLLATIKRYLCLNEAGDESKCQSPIAIIIYPRLALARDQFERLVRYTSVLNDVLRRYNKDPISISINNMDVLSTREYLRTIRNIQNQNKLAEGKCVEDVVASKYSRIPVQICKADDNTYEISFTSRFTFFKCPNNTYPKIHINLSRGEFKLLCNDIDYSFVKITKDDVSARPGDIHVTLFETLRLNLVSPKWNKLFGSHDTLKGPIFIVLDEIHTYTDITGARYAYLLRRLMTKIKWLTNRKHGFVVLGLSATLPEITGKEFLRRLFMQPDERNIIEITPEEDEVIPAGSDYFYIIIPNYKELIDAITVSIQALMALHFNIPPIILDHSSRHSKKTFAFADSLEIVARLRYDLSDALYRENLNGGLQDLRNVFHNLFHKTMRDYGDYENRELSNIQDEKDLLKLLELKKISSIKSWSDGELWWPYSLEYKRYAELVRLSNDIAKYYVRVYTSKVRENLEQPGIIVATSSLEVGVDYSDVVVIYQHGAPFNISSLIQRAGRGGRRVYINPLLRTVIAIQLSPEVPHQTYLLEIFLRSGSLREALNYDILNVPTDNPTIKEQVLVETILDYYTLVKGSSKIRNIFKFECEELPKFISNHRQDILNYFSHVLKLDNDESISKLLDAFLNFVSQSCKGAIR